MFLLPNRVHERIIFGNFSFLGYRVILASDFFNKSLVNNTPINRYHAPGGFGKTSAPTAVATPAMR